MSEKKQIFIIVGLLILLLIVWALVLSSPKRSSKETIASAEGNGLELKVILQMVEDLNKKDTVMELSYAEDKDPFSLREKSASGEKVITSKILKGLSLKGILWDSQKPLAIINEEVVGEGGMIKGIKIKRIEPSHVVLEVEGEEKVLFIEGVKKEKEGKKIKMEGETDEKIAPVGIY